MRSKPAIVAPSLHARSEDGKPPNAAAHCREQHGQRHPCSDRAIGELFSGGAMAMPCQPAGVGGLKLREFAREPPGGRSGDSQPGRRAKWKADDAEGKGGSAPRRPHRRRDLARVMTIERGRRGAVVKPLGDEIAEGRSAIMGDHGEGLVAENAPGLVESPQEINVFSIEHRVVEPSGALDRVGAPDERGGGGVCHPCRRGNDRWIVAEVER